MAIETLNADANGAGTCATPSAAVGTANATWTTNTGTTKWTHEWPLSNPVNSPLSSGHTVRAWVRKEAGQSGTPSAILVLRQGATTLATSGSQNVTSGTGQFITFDPGTISITDASDLRVEIQATGAGGNPSTRTSIQVDYIEVLLDTFVITVYEGTGALSGGSGELDASGAHAPPSAIESVATWDGTTAAPNTVGSGWTVGNLGTNGSDLNTGVVESGSNADPVYVGVWAPNCHPSVSDDGVTFYSTDPVFRWGSMATDEATAVSGDKYFSVTISRADSGAFTPERLTYKASRGGPATPRGLSVRTSADGFATTLGGGDIPTQRNVWTDYDIDLSGIGEVTTLEIRFYSWMGVNTYTVEADDIEVTAVVSAGVEHPGTAALSGGSGDVDSAGSTAPIVYSGTAAISGGSGDVDSAGSTAPLVETGTAALTGGSGEIDATGSTSALVETGTSELAGGGGELSAAGSTQEAPTVLGTWDGTSLAPATTDPDWNVSSLTNDGTMFGPILANDNPTPNYATQPVYRWIPGDVDETTAKANDRFFSVTISRVDSAPFTPGAFALNIARGGSGTPRGFAIYTDADSYAAALFSVDVPTARPTFTHYEVDLSGVGEVTSLVVRVYSWTLSTGSTLEADDLSITATASPVGDSAELAGGGGAIDASGSTLPLVTSGTAALEGGAGAISASGSTSAVGAGGAFTNAFSDAFDNGPSNSADLAGGGGAIDSSGSTAPTIHSGAAAMAGGAGELDAAGSTSVTVESGTAALAGGGGQLSASGSAGGAVNTGTAELAGGSGEVDGAGATAALVETGAADLAGGSGDVDSAGSTSSLVETGSAELAGGEGSVEAAGSTTTPVTAGSADLAGGGGQLAAAGASGGDVNVGTASLAGGGGEVDSAGSTSSSTTTGTAELAGDGGSLSAVGAAGGDVAVGTASLAGGSGSVDASGSTSPTVITGTADLDGGGGAIASVGSSSGSVTVGTAEISGGSGAVNATGSTAAVVSVGSVDFSGGGGEISSSGATGITTIVGTAELAGGSGQVAAFGSAGGSLIVGSAELSGSGKLFATNIPNYGVLWYWDGVEEVPAFVSYYDGTSEVPVVDVEVV